VYERTLESPHTLYMHSTSGGHKDDKGVVESSRYLMGIETELLR